VPNSATPRDRNSSCRRRRNPIRRERGEIAGRDPLTVIRFEYAFDTEVLDPEVLFEVARCSMRAEVAPYRRLPRGLVDSCAR
jgi:hypothetical protein